MRFHKIVIASYCTFTRSGIEDVCESMSNPPQILASVAQVNYFLPIFHTFSQIDLVILHLPDRISSIIDSVVLLSHAVASVGSDCNVLILNDLDSDSLINDYIKAIPMVYDIVRCSVSHNQMSAYLSRALIERLGNPEVTDAK